MTIKRIDNALCKGCGICVKSCPADVIRIDAGSKKAVIQYPEDCMLCQWCKTDCPQQAIDISPEKGSPLLTSWG